MWVCFLFWSSSSLIFYSFLLKILRNCYKFFSQIIAREKSYVKHFGYFFLVFGPKQHNFRAFNPFLGLKMGMILHFFKIFYVIVFHILQEDFSVFFYVIFFSFFPYFFAYFQSLFYGIFPAFLCQFHGFFPRISCIISPCFFA